MRQLALPIRPDAPPGFDDFVVGENVELLARLRGLAAGQEKTHLLLWGEPGSGRSHLLRAAATAATAAGADGRYIDAARLEDALPPADRGLLAIDDAGQLSAGGQLCLFNLINAARERGLHLLVSAGVPPAQLSLREDLRTRLGSFLVFEVKPLGDEQKMQTLAHHAQARGMRVAPDLIAYLLNHGRRDLRSLMAVLDALDRASLEQKRHITLPLVREVLAGFEG